MEAVGDRTYHQKEMESDAMGRERTDCAHNVSE